MVYHDNPRDGHAGDAVYAVAELLAEQGRELEDDKSLRAAVGQYEFLRTQYPSSALRTAALAAEAHLDEEDLGDHAAAKERYATLVKESPRSAEAAGARKWLAGQVRLKIETAAAPVVTASPVLVPPHRDEAAMNGLRSAVPATESRPLAQVTGIRHWSTATYTRVAIDLGDQVTFEAARVPNPDRIYFDLHGARLAQELAGKSFDVTDDGFLKKIRAAQAGGDVTRVVLDVNDVTEYSAFLLPNPYRLIIDIHGAKKDAATGATEEKTPMVGEVPVAPAAAKRASAAANVSGLPAMAPTDGGDAVRPVSVRPVAVATKDAARAPNTTPRLTAPPPVVAVAPAVITPQKPVPNTVTVLKPATASEVAAVSDSPGRVGATSMPTSRPVAASVARKKDDKVPMAAPVKAADKTADGETSLVRALGLKIGRIVIDAGHGGHDSGTLGVDGLQEKDVVLDVALRVGKLLHERLGAEIIYTRSDDTFIPLETRTAIANKAQADLFLSIHANSSQDASARGVETYYLNFTSDNAALEVAARENAVGGQGIHQLSDLVKKIALKDKIAESREFAADVEGSLYAGLARGNNGLRDRGVKKAPFVVLIGANMPSILAEISFVTNARDAEQLREPEYRQRVAESLFTGVARYEGGLAGAKAAGPAMKRASLQ